METGSSKSAIRTATSSSSAGDNAAFATLIPGNLSQNDRFTAPFPSHQSPARTVAFSAPTYIYEPDCWDQSPREAAEPLRRHQASAWRMLLNGEDRDTSNRRPVCR